jgi:uncharacterized protein
MSEDTARHALNIVFESPATRIKIEFQGGEPLLNFPLITTVVSEAQAKARAARKKVEFVIASNLALLDDTILRFCKANHVLFVYFTRWACGPSQQKPPASRRE